MHVFVLITGIVLFPKVYALKCNECTGYGTNECISTERECPAGYDRCATSRITEYAGGAIFAEVNVKGCLPASHCVEGSRNFGQHRGVFSGKCCTTDLCNDQPAPKPAAPRPNGKKCIGCLGSEACNKTVDCADGEDHCFSRTVGAGFEKVTVKGCISKDYCLMNGLEALLYPISAETISAEMTCSSAGSTGGNLLLLVVTVVSLVIFS